MKHVWHFFDMRKGSRIDLFSARSDIYVVKFDLFVFIEGVIFQKVHNNIKLVVWYGDSRFETFLIVSSHFHRNFQFWILFYLVTKSSNQLLIKANGGLCNETYIRWKVWFSSFRKNCQKWWEVVRKAVVRFLKKYNFQSHQRWQHIIKIHTYEIIIMFLHKKVSKILRKVFLLIKS